MKHEVAQNRANIGSIRNAKRGINSAAAASHYNSQGLSPTRASDSLQRQGLSKMKDYVIKITSEQQFNNLLVKEKRPIIVDFHNDSVTHCNYMSPFFD